MTTRAAFLVMALVLSGCSAPGTVTPYLYDNGPDYLSEGLMRIQDSSGKIGYADEKGGNRNLTTVCFRLSVQKRPCQGHIAGT